MTTTDPREARRLAIIQTALDLTREAFGERFDELEAACADAAADSTDDGDAKPILAKLAISFSWPAGEDRPELTAVASYTIRRKLELSAPTDAEQVKIDFAGGDTE